MTDRELMQQALEALEVATTPLAKDRQEVLRAQAVLRSRLAQPEQEPVGVLRTLVQIHADGTETWREEPVWNAPPQRKPLTDEEISDLWCKVSNTDFVTADTHVFARAIEAAHGIKGEA